MKQTIRAILILLAGPVFSQTLQHYEAAAVSRNPAVSAAWHEWQSELKNTNAVRGLPDLTVSFGYFLENIETAVGPQQWKVGVMQMIPWPGKLIARGQLQTARAEAARNKMKNTVAEIVYTVQMTYLDGYFLEQNIAITRKNLNLVRQWEQVILAKYATATASHPDLIKTQIEAVKLQDDLNTLQAGRRPLLEKFRAMIHSDTLSGIVYPDSLDIPGARLDSLTVRQMILKGNPNLASGLSLQQAAQKNLAQTKMNWLPDFSIGLDYIRTGDKVMGGNPVFESGKDPLILMGSLTLPIWGVKQISQIRSAREKVEQSREALSDMSNALEAAFEQAWFVYRDAARKQRLYQNELLPMSLESLRVTEKAYISHQMELLSLIDAQRRYLAFTLNAEKAVIDQLKAIALLQKLAGRPL